MRLSPGIGAVAATVAALGGVALAVHALVVTGRPRAVRRSVEDAVVRLVREALTNVVKHAEASEVKVSAVTADDELHLSISDDGIGGAVAGAGSGLIGLKDRVEALAGRLDISSPPGSGTTLTVVIPLQGE